MTLYLSRAYSKNHPKSQKGFTLIETVVATVILSFALLSLIQLFTNLAQLQANGDYRKTATLLAHEMIEEVTSRRFDELTAQVGGNWSTLGVDGGETLGVKSTYDDIDDFNGWNETMTAPFLGFTRTATVFYVAPGNLNTASASNNGYKRVRVQVLNNGTLFADIVTLVSSVSN